MADPTPPDPFPGLDDLIAPGATLETLATDLRFIEGPVWIADQLIFSDIPANKLLTHSDAKGLGLLRQPSANANGNTVDPQGRLVSCLHGDRSVVRTELDGKITLLADRFHGKRFNSPNDVAIQRDGTIWFSDPTYGLGGAQPELTQRWVFRMNPDASDLTPTVADAIQPNGLCFSPDEKRLYIADSGAKPGLVRVYDVDGKTLNNPRIFCEIDAGVPDGMRCDAQGRLWAGCGDGVQVFAPDGTRLGRVLTPTPVTNCCFGGERGDDLYLTASTTLYRIKTKTTGSTSHQLPK